MFIPNYQIHNILKDFTQQLKRAGRGRKPTKGPGKTLPGNSRRPCDLRLTSVAGKVAENIMERLADLGEEARHKPPVESQGTSRQLKEAPPVFDYHLLDGEKGKVKQHLVVEDSRNLVQRFQQMTTAAPPTHEIETTGKPD